MSRSSKIISLDLDGCLYAWDVCAKALLIDVLPNSPYTRQGPLGKDSTSWSYIKNNISNEHWNWLWSSGIHEGLFSLDYEYTGAIEFVERLSHKLRVNIITHRPVNVKQQTLTWIKNKGFNVNEIHVLDSRIPKSSVVPHSSFYLDDKPENVIDLLMNANISTSNVFLMDRPWNHYALELVHQRVYDYEEIYERVVEGL